MDNRQWAKTFYQSRTWRRCRKEFLQSKGWLCEECLTRGLLSPATEAHHIKHLTPDNVSNPEIALNWNNLKALCKQCHLEEHKREKERRYTVDENGVIIF